jgi:predicted RNA-binding Zn ribbon-like protein
MVTHNHPEPASGPSVETLDLVGGELCLDFVNTGSSRAVGPFVERLRRYDDLVRWGERTGALEPVQAQSLRAAAATDPAHAEHVLEEARALREAIYRVFRARCDGAPPAASDLALLNSAAARATTAQQLIATESGFDVTWPETAALERAWWPVATSALALLLSSDVARVKECAGENCNWLFLDASKNRSRRWCEMKDCGNRAKARRHYARRKTND